MADTMKARLAGIVFDVCAATHGPEGRATVSLNLSSGRASMTSRAFDDAGKPVAVVSLYSSEHKTIGFRPADPRDATAVLVSNKHGKGHGGRQFAASMLARRMRADGYAGSIRVPVQWHPDGLLWGDLTMAIYPRKTNGGGGASDRSPITVVRP
jgi:hypothetical protein